MFSFRPDAVRQGLAGAVILLALAVAPSISFAGKGKGAPPAPQTSESAAVSEPASEATNAPADAPRGRAQGWGKPLPVPGTRGESAAPRVTPQPWTPPPAESRRVGVPREPAAPAWSRLPADRGGPAIVTEPPRPRPLGDQPTWNPSAGRRNSAYDLYRKPSGDPAPAETSRRVSTPSVPSNARPTIDGGRSRPVPTVEQDNTRERERSRQEEQSRLRVPSTPATPPSGNRRLGIPSAPFRGPEADEKVRIVPRERQQETQRQLIDRLRNVNGFRGVPDRALPGRDVVGNPVPAKTGRLIRDDVAGLRGGYERIRRQLGYPEHNYIIVPRRPSDYWDGYWDGYTNGYRDGQHHPLVVINFYYPYYWSDPYWFAFHYPGYHPSIYHYWGWCPGWVHPARVYYVPVEYVYVAVTPYRYYYSGYQLDQVGAQRAVEDVRRAWFESEIGSLAAHLTDELDIRIYFDGEYEYSTSTDDYYAMTVDAMATTQTVAMDFEAPIWLSSHEVFYTGRHVFYDPEGGRQQVYVSYRFRRLGAEWYLVAVGSSLEPIRHQYRDFRYT